MDNSFNEKILNDVAQEIEKIITQVKEEEEMVNNTSAIDILKKVNKRINNWMEDSSILISFHDERIEEIIEESKKEITQAAKNEIAFHIASIVTDGKGSVTERISAYAESLKEEGIDFDNKEEKDSQEIKPARNKALAHTLINHTPVTPRRSESRRYNRYEDEGYSGCGGGSSSGCGGGGC